MKHEPAQLVRLIRIQGYVGVVFILALFVSGAVVMLAEHPSRWSVLVVMVMIIAGSCVTFYIASKIYRTRTRIERGLCLACGYDLRASEGATCPECGATREPLA